MKTVDELAEDWMTEEYGNTSNWTYAGKEMSLDAFVAGYQAAKDEYKVAIDTYNDVAKQMMEEAVRIMSPKDSAHIDTNSIDTGTKMQWISVKERLPEHFEDVLTFEDGECYRVNSISQLTKYWWDSDEGFERHPSHWMPLPEAPKGEG